MVKVYPNAEFDGDFPDDGVEEGGDLVVFPGGNVAEAIADSLQRAGMKTNKPEHLGEHGWGFHAGYKRPSVWIMLNMSEDQHYHMFVQRSSILDSILFRAKRVHREFLIALDRELKADPRFSNVAWFAERDSFNEAPSPIPVQEGKAAATS